MLCDHLDVWDREGGREMQEGGREGGRQGGREGKGKKEKDTMLLKFIITVIII